MEKYIQCLYFIRYPLERSVHPKNQEIDPKNIPDSILGDSDHSVALILKQNQGNPTRENIGGHGSQI